ncbi:hypothetical protein ANO14919_067080 [Xylariales sp. No.14919]|nr:hypothetical protein ANO14919_067080 [Xylariales sp. No.14919]
MRAQIASAVAALAACAAAVPTASGAVAQLETRATGTFDGDHLWKEIYLGNPFSTPYTISWVSFGVSGYSNDSPSFFVSCTALYDSRKPVADAAWYPCIGFPFDGGVEAQYYFNSTAAVINVKQTYVEGGEHHVKIGSANISGGLYPNETFSLPTLVVV